MILYQSHQTTPHRFPLGHHRYFDGIRGVLCSYTVRGNLRYRLPGGKFVVVAAGTLADRRRRQGFGSKWHKKGRGK